MCSTIEVAVSSEFTVNNRVFVWNDLKNKTQLSLLLAALWNLIWSFANSTCINLINYMRYYFKNLEINTIYQFVDEVASDHTTKNWLRKTEILLYTISNITCTLSAYSSLCSAFFVWIFCREKWHQVPSLPFHVGNIERLIFDTTKQQ